MSAQTTNDTLDYKIISCSGLTGIKAEYPGGETFFNRLLKTNLNKRSLKKLENTHTQHIAILTIEKDGQISDISISGLNDKKLLNDICNIIGLMPKCNPTIENGKSISSKLSLPITL